MSSERTFRRKYKSESKENIFEFITESVAYFGVEYGILAQLGEVGYMKAIMNKRNITALVPLLYYGYKDLLLPNVIQAIVYYLAESKLGRWILSKLMKIESQKFIMIAINTMVLISLQKFFGEGIAAIDITQIIITQLLEFGVDEASEYLF